MQVFSTAVARLHEVSCNIHAQHVCAEICSRYGRIAVTTCKIKDLLSSRYSKGVNKRLAAFSKSYGKTREVAFFPEGLVRIHRKPLLWSLASDHAHDVFGAYIMFESDDVGNGPFPPGRGHHQ